MRDFKKLDVWNEARHFVKEIYELTYSLPPTEKFGLISQINRCAISIPANIAEGCAKDSQKDFARFLKMSLGSAFELESHLVICADLGFISKKQVALAVEKVRVLQKRIASLIKYVRTKF